MKMENEKSSQSTISSSQVIFTHVCYGLVLSIGFWVAHNVYSINLVFDPTNTLHLIWAIKCPVVILLFSCIRQKSEKCSYFEAVARGLLELFVGAILNALGALALGAPVGLQYVILEWIQSAFFEKTINWSLLMSLFTDWPICVSYGAMAGYVVGMVGSFGLAVMRGGQKQLKAE